MATGDQADELPEHLATGAIAAIYAEIRRCSGVTYVSSLQRYLATHPGLLEWGWGALAPAMTSGAIPEAGWRMAETARLAPLPPAPEFGAARAMVRAIAANFVRVAPVNMVFGASLRRLLEGAVPGGGGFAPDWVAPDPLPAMPGNLDPAALAPGPRAALMRFVTELDGKPFIPALYRQLAHVPSALEWLAEMLPERLAAPEATAEGDALRAAAGAAADRVLAGLSQSGPAPADTALRARVLGAIARYAVTSPELILAGRAILEAVAG
ncbi:MAG: hypothetical protein KGI51_11125 [Rhodospirillales bacterium]|nr:hypothetical protein [Rhodospirillales bacterium]